MSPRGERSGRFFWGLVLVVVGTLFLLDQLNVADAGHIISRYWPVILIVIGLWILVTHDFRNSLGGLVLVGVGGIFLLINLDIFHEDVWSYAWPLAIIVLGLWLILRPRFRPGSGQFPAVKGDDLDATNIFSGMKRTITSPKFRGGRATVIFGGMELDFTPAGLDDGQATIDLTALFGSIEVFVPKEWRVIVDATPVLGGVDDKHRSVPDSEIKATLHIKATAVFGGIEIKN